MNILRPRSRDWSGENGIISQIHEVVIQSPTVVIVAVASVECAVIDDKPRCINADFLKSMMRVIIRNIQQT